MSGSRLVLRANPTHEDDDWRFTVSGQLVPPKRPGLGKLVSLNGEGISLSYTQFPSNRVINADDPTKFILLSIDRSFRFPEQPMRATVDYILRMFKKGLFLNGIQYRFYGHSNSQLRGRSCFLREANNDEELDAKLYAMGDFEKIMNVAKRAKRIGLLFSAAQVDYILDPKFIGDIPDIRVGDEVFSDGCGLISKRLAVAVSKKKRIIFRGTRYTPTVFQIRYLGYKGVLMLHPDLDERKEHLAEFRQSMKKFTTTADKTFSVVGHSKPYTFGRLNNDIIVLLWSLGISADRFLAKQKEYFDWVTGAAEDVTKAIDFLSSLDTTSGYVLAEHVLLKGLDDEIVKKIRKFQNTEIAGARQENTGKFKSKIIVHQSRRLYGVCDPYQVLEEGQVHIRITMARKGPSTPIHGDVIIVRNPCLHPGDILKLRAVDHPRLRHLTDCLVFASQARLGRQAPPSMSSGGDLDGDEFFVCWDSDLVPTSISQSYDYPGNKEFKSLKVTRMDLAKHFASYNLSGVARVSALHAKWARSSSLGALCVQCQELNALHSQSVDGAPIKIPPKLANPPEQKEQFILDILEKSSDEFSRAFSEAAPQRSELVELDKEDGNTLLRQLLLSRQNSLSEYQLFDLAFKFSRKHDIDLKPFLAHLDFSAMTTAEKKTLTTALNLSAIDYPEIWNSFARSAILKPRDLHQRNLHHPFSLHRLYSSIDSGMPSFYEYLKMANEEYVRRVIIIQTEARFAVGIFLRGHIPWDQDPDPEVSQNVVVVSFMPESGSTIATHKPCTPGYKLHCSDMRFQLYDKHLGNTFIFISNKVEISIALQKISETVRRQLGGIARMAARAIEIHVVSNRDRVAHQLFDMWFNHVPTEETIRRFQRNPSPYRLNDLLEVKWDEEDDEEEQSEVTETNGELSEAEKEKIRAAKEKKKETRILKSLKGAFFRCLPGYPLSSHVQKHNDASMRGFLQGKSLMQIDWIVRFVIKYHAEDELFMVFNFVVGKDHRDLPYELVESWIGRFPPLAFALLQAYPPDEDCALPEILEPLAVPIVRNIIRSANDTRIAALVALEKIAQSIGSLPLYEYLELLMVSALSIRSKQLVQEVLLVLNDSRLAHAPPSPAGLYGHKHALAVAFDRAEEAGDECPCDEDGRPRKKMRVAPSHANLTFAEDYDTDGHIKATYRIDAKSSIRLHSHIRLQAASKAENRWINAPIMDGLVVQAMKGELKIKLMHPAPPEMELMDWNIYDCGSIATANAMMDALQRLLAQKTECCKFYDLIVGDSGPSEADVDTIQPSSASPPPNLNESQIEAMNSWRSRLSLIWGPPGTGKTTVMVQILLDILRSHKEPPRIIMTASTHNAVDNVLERFIAENSREQLLTEEQILRVATDQSKVNQSLQSYTINARVGGDMNENNRLVKQAQQRVEKARLVFTTCAGAGLGILRKVDFEIALIDEASQITEPCALIPLVKGIGRAVVVGDHVQLRPMVRKVGMVLESDVSLLERLYTKSGDLPGLAKTMLDVQYRSPRELNAFPSNEFYEGRLRTSERNAEVANFLSIAKFPWPVRDGTVIPAVFIQCSEEEDMGDRSKSNQGQVDLISKFLPLLKSQRDVAEDIDTQDVQKLEQLQVTVLSPYVKQVTTLRHRLPSTITSSTVDSFQGRESDIIIFSAVRCNAEGDVGFLEDHRRLNVMWTRARLGLIIVGDRTTMSTNPLWKRALDACAEVTLPPDSE